MGEVRKIEVVDIPRAEGVNVILGQSHFIKTVEDLYEALVTSVPNVRFGVAFCESSGKRLIRYDGNDEELVSLAIEAARRVGAGHFFAIYLRNAWPINVVDSIRKVSEVVALYAASANPMQVIVAETDLGRSVLGVVDGGAPLGVEGDYDKKERHALLRKIGYKK
ncbi:MAG: adenosine-specific kinase [Sulfolobales archaeon]|nr:adenosine-specific kinase [Sulfolobales archaeon]MCX8208487.1 adenosine-specific kinase [Sulfolobales archaeon]MDW8010034.1 adenosine-specific kinase [Sulfolobales archaeon]